jgi:hypothetical protein
VFRNQGSFVKYTAGDKLFWQAALCCHQKYFSYVLFCCHLEKSTNCESKGKYPKQRGTKLFSFVERSYFHLWSRDIAISFLGVHVDYRLCHSPTKPNVCGTLHNGDEIFGHCICLTD